MASASGRDSPAKARQGMMSARMRPSGRTPVCSAAMISARDQLPSPVALSGVRFGPKKVPPGVRKPTSEPPSRRWVSGSPRRYPGVWQSPQPPSRTRYCPRPVPSSWPNAPVSGSSPAHSASALISRDMMDLHGAGSLPVRDGHDIATAVLRGGWRRRRAGACVAGEPVQISSRRCRRAKLPGGTRCRASTSARWASGSLIACWSVA